MGGSTHQPPVLHLVWNLIRGGTEGQCARTAMQLAGAGWPQRVGVSRREGYFLGAVEHACGPVHEMRIHAMLRPGTVLEIHRLVRFIRAEHIALVHAWDADAAIFGALAANWAGIPLITSRRDLGEIYGPRKLLLMRWADRRAHAVVVNARAIARSAACRGVAAERIHVIPNILDAVEFDQRASTPHASLPELGPGRWIAMVARLDPEKDVQTLLRAVPLVVRQVPESRFLIVGDGRERTSLEQLAARLGILAQVRFAGEYNEIPALLKRCAAGVLVPNRNEGLSNTILEYMAAGLPVVATECGGNRELVEDGRNGFVVPAGDADAVADRLVRLLRDPQRSHEMGASGRALIAAHHQPDAIAARFAALYRSILSR
ncbi:MAG TPA: glycosyltransferase [Kiritimatiellia bacterium]|nr:glycosyltransferase [Kiritimatiellia bacterium]